MLLCEIIRWLVLLFRHFWRISLTWCLTALSDLFILFFSIVYALPSSWQKIIFSRAARRILAVFRKSNPQDQRALLHWHVDQICSVWLWRIAGAFPRHLICLSKPSHRETKPPSNAPLLSLDLSLATRLPLLSCWQRLTRHDVQLERMFAITPLLRTLPAWCVLASPCRAVHLCPLSSQLSRLEDTCYTVSGLIMASVGKLRCKCWVKGNDQCRSQGPAGLQTATSCYL